MKILKQFREVIKRFFTKKNPLLLKAGELTKIFTAPAPEDIEAPCVEMEGGDVYELLALSQHVYQDNNSWFSTSRIPRDWMEADPSALAEGIVLKEAESGLKSVLYKNLLTNDYVYAFCGTDAFCLKDWTTNIKNGLGMKTEQYNRAKMNTSILAEAVKKEGKSLQLTGHSLGGGLASYAATVCGVPAVTFNASGVTAEILAENDKTLVDAAKVVTAYYLRGEYLTLAQEKKAYSSLLPDAIGHQIEVPYGVSVIDRFVLRYVPVLFTLLLALRHGNMRALAMGLLKLKIPKRLR